MNVAEPCSLHALEHRETIASFSRITNRGPHPKIVTYGFGFGLFFRRNPMPALTPRQFSALSQVWVTRVTPPSLMMGIRSKNLVTDSRHYV